MARRGERYIDGKLYMLCGRVFGFNEGKDEGFCVDNLPLHQIRFAHQVLEN